MPMDKSKYPADWKQISLRIRERDNNQCKFCGVPNYAFVTRDAQGQWRILKGMELDTAGLDGDKVTRVVLTVAHLDRGPKDCADDRLAALCQRCHLLYDLDLHVAKAAETRRLKKESLGQSALSFFD
jgi:hypothetical protein